jgi:signal transduction histidine kinase
LEEGEIDRCIEQALDEVRLSATKRNIRIKGDVTPPSRPMRFDPSQVEQVLANLLENACKFTPSGGRIKVSGYPCGSKLFRVDVFNTGPGISAEWLERVFDEYTSFGGDAAGGARSGVGLGLAISKSIIEHHEGRIWIENQSEGPCISFVLPVESSAGSFLSSQQKNERYEQNGTR